jgi:hypothetical protein
LITASVIHVLHFYRQLEHIVQLQISECASHGNPDTLTIVGEVEMLVKEEHVHKDP